jgi:predicted metal-dependent hydrolase
MLAACTAMTVTYPNLRKPVDPDGHTSNREAGPLGQLSLWSCEQRNQYWRVRVSRRARRMSIRVLAGGCVEIVVPPWMRPRAIEQFVHRHRGWVDRKVREFRFRMPASSGVLPESIELAACGEVWRLRTNPGARHAVKAVAGAMTLELSADPHRLDEVRRGLQRWLIAQARRVLVPWVERLTAETGLSHRRVQVRRQRTRWGSCSPAGTISLNCCLLFQSPAVVRYLLLHELCHTRHMNHSRRFWRLLTRHDPDCRALDRVLTRGWQNVPAWVWEPA